MSWRPGRSIGFQQTVFYKFVWVGRVVREAVHHITDVIEDIGRQLRENIVSFFLR